MDHSTSLDQSLVTIALPVFNGGATLAVAVRSILQQSFQNWELIILDDRSTDDSLEVIRSFDDPRIRLVEGEENVGLSARLNMAVDMANGRYFARMDQDDVSFPQRLEKQLEYLKFHPNVDLLASSIIVFKGNGESLGKVKVKYKHGDICFTPWSGFYMPHPTWMGRIEWFRAHRYKSFADGAEDSHLLFRSYRESCFAGLDTPLLGYRQDMRTLKKLYSQRYIFSKSLAHEALVSHRPLLAIKIIFLQIMKAGGDVLNVVFGFTRMRNDFAALGAEEEEAWKRIWKELNS